MTYSEDVIEYNSEHLLLYRLCSNIAVIIGVMGGAALLAVYSPNFQKYPLSWVIAIGLPLTIILVIGKYHFPRICSFALLLKYQILGIYTSWLGFDAILFLSSICSVFYLMGYIESVQTFRLKNGCRSLWLGEAGVLQYALIIVIGIALTTLVWVYIPQLICYAIAL